MENLVSSLDEFSTNETVKLAYPYILIHGTGDPLKVTLDAVAKGDLPVCIVYKDVTLNVADVSRSALELSKILTVYEISVYLSMSEVHRVRNNIELLELGAF